MGYDVTLRLEHTSQRKAFDDAAGRFGREYPIVTWGKDEPSDWEVKALWDAGSAFADFTDELKWECQPVEAAGDMTGSEGLYVPSELLVSIGHVVDALEAVVGDELHTASLLANVSETDADEYWMALCTGVKSRKVIEARVPFVGSARIARLQAKVTHDDANAYWTPLYGTARDAVSKVRLAEIALEQARGALAKIEFGPEAQRDMANDLKKDVEAATARLEAARKEAAEVEGTDRPVIDTIDFGSDISLDGRVMEGDASFDVEERDPLAGYAFKAKVVGAIASVPLGSGDRMFSAVYELLTEYPGQATAWLRQIADIGQVAAEADIDRLVWEAGW